MSDAQSDLLADQPTDGLVSRKVALNILSQVLGQKKMLDSVLEREAQFLALPTRDRAFVRMLAATALRRKGQLDDLIGRTLSKGEIPRPDALRWLLYIGITQILFMDVPDHAAVDTSVTIAGHEGMETKKAFVNAVLRRMAGEEGKEWLSQQDEASLNIPSWLYHQWTESYGQSKTRDMARASLEEASLDISLKNVADKEVWAAKLDAVILPTGSLRRRTGGHVTDLPGFAEGEWWVQDASSALPVKLLGDVSGKTVLDLCAAPGGKTAQLAAAGAKVIAADRSAPRMAVLNENLARLNLQSQVQCMVEDASLWRPKEQFDYILLDAPCSATGTIRRHPDLLTLKTEKDQQGLISIQERLLRNAADMVKASGLMIYCTCSLQKAEGEEQVDRFLMERPDFRRVPVRASEIGNIIGGLTAEGDVRILPHHFADKGGMDGFYIARLQKV